MKTVFLLLFSFLTVTAWAQENPVKEVSFTVYGNCSMCKARIEKALDLKGVKRAEWDMRSHRATVVFHSGKISEQQLHEALWAVGHDTEKGRAPDEAYQQLHTCCQFQRKPLSE